MKKLLCFAIGLALSFAAVAQIDTTKKFYVNGQEVTENVLDSIIAVVVRQTMDSIRARKYIAKPKNTTSLEWRKKSRASENFYTAELMKRRRTNS
jgi:Skp family chaperone for outer membrane proteins